MPEPPGPVRVSSLCSERRASTSEASRPRPTKLESSKGRLLGGRRPSDGPAEPATLMGSPALFFGAGRGVSARLLS